MCVHIYPNPGLLHCRQILYHFDPPGKPLYRKIFITKNWVTVEIDKSRICSVGWQAEDPEELKVHNLESWKN